MLSIFPLLCVISLLDCRLEARSCFRQDCCSHRCHKITKACAKHVRDAAAHTTAANVSCGAKRHHILRFTTNASHVIIRDTVLYREDASCSMKEGFQPVTIASAVMSVCFCGSCSPAYRQKRWQMRCKKAALSSRRGVESQFSMLSR
jgi:hypothetical protein